MRRSPVVLVAGLACLLQGCVLGVGWVPDSSGFVFTTPKGHLVAYDIKAKKQRVVMKDPAAATTCWPAVSPGGKRIALAHLQDTAEKTGAVLQIVVCDMKGRVEFRSDKLKFATFSGKDVEYATQLVWSPDERHILIQGNGTANQGLGFDTSALFDIAAKKITLWDKHMPAYFGGSPVRPDGKGFLLVGSEKSNDAAYYWVEWTGKKVRIPRFDHKEGEDEPLPPLSALNDSRWDGAKAILTVHKHRYIIDTKELKHSVENIPEADNRIGRELIQTRGKLAGGVELLMLIKDDGNKSGPAVRVVARKKGDSALTEVIAPVRDRMMLLSLSPDRKHAIVRVSYGHRGTKEDTIYVLNAQGRRHDEIDVPREYGKK